MNQPDKPSWDIAVPDPWADTDPGADLSSAPADPNQASVKQPPLGTVAAFDSDSGNSGSLEKQRPNRTAAPATLDALPDSSVSQGPQTSDSQVSVDPYATVPPPSQPRNDEFQIGPYYLLERLGEGGMGEVWLAEQSVPFKRQVAIKMIRSGKEDSQHFVARFDAERQALALMNHRHIAKVFDAGLSDRWGPYFVMEYCPGRPINQFAERKRLSLQDRLRVFLQVCRAVEHAHQKGIIHRDLKPNNILVSAVNRKVEAKVIDFGLAKAAVAEIRLTDKSLSTHIGQPLGTYKYMSPEQTRSDPNAVDTRSDIYSLGVILYELLTGVPALDACVTTPCEFDELLRLIREKDPPLPSQGLSESVVKHSLPRKLGEAPAGAVRSQAKKLRKELAGELDWIVMKALEKNPARRYPTASALIEDVQNFLQGAPISARPRSRRYSLQKFAERHRLALGLATAGMVALILLASLSAWGLIGWSRLQRDYRALRETLQHQPPPPTESASNGAVQNPEDASNDSEELERLRESLATVRQELNGSQQRLRESQEQLGQAMVERDSAKSELAGRQAEINNWNTKYNQISAQLKSVEGQNSELNQRLDAQGTSHKTVVTDLSEQISTLKKDLKDAQSLVASNRKLASEISALTEQQQQNQTEQALARAHLLLHEHQYGDARTMLDSVPVAHRGIEWKMAKQSLENRSFYLVGHESPVTAVAFDHTGDFLISADSSGVFCKWDLRGKRLLKKVNSNLTSVQVIALSPDGKSVFFTDLGNVEYRDFQDLSAKKSDTIFASQPTGIRPNVKVGDYKLSHDHSTLVVRSSSNTSGNSTVAYHIPSGRKTAISLSEQDFAITPDGGYVIQPGVETQTIAIDTKTGGAANNLFDLFSGIRWVDGRPAESSYFLSDGRLGASGADSTDIQMALSPPLGIFAKLISSRSIEFYFASRKADSSVAISEMLATDDLLFGDFQNVAIHPLGREAAIVGDGPLIHLVDLARTEYHQKPVLGEISSFGFVDSEWWHRANDLQQWDSVKSRVKETINLGDFTKDHKIISSDLSSDRRFWLGLFGEFIVKRDASMPNRLVVVDLQSKSVKVQTEVMAVLARFVPKSTNILLCNPHDATLAEHQLGASQLAPHHRIITMIDSSPHDLRMLSNGNAFFLAPCISSSSVNRQEFYALLKWAYPHQAAPDRLLKSTSDHYTRLTLDSDEDYLLALANSTLNLWSTRSNRAIWSIPRNENIIDAVFVPDESKILISAETGLRLIEKISGEPIARFPNWRPVEGYYSDIAPGCKHLALNFPQTTAVFPLTTAQNYQSILLSDMEKIIEYCLSPDELKIGVLTADQQHHLVDVNTGVVEKVDRIDWIRSGRKFSRQAQLLVQAIDNQLAWFSMNQVTRLSQEQDKLLTQTSQVSWHTQLAIKAEESNAHFVALAHWCAAHHLDNNSPYILDGIKRTSKKWESAITEPADKSIRPALPSFVIEGLKAAKAE